MEEIKTNHCIFTAKVKSLYNCQTEIYEKQPNKNVKLQKNERAISVRCYRKKISYKVLLKKVEYTILELHIDDLNKNIKINITNFLIKKYKGQKISKKLLSVIKARISKEIVVKYVDRVWRVADYDNLFIK